ncbi:MAG TPA: Rieske (2Fe-2S) protein [bacterium]|nr:Rieske (2Fe-2S) protein [bacterium]
MTDDATGAARPDGPEEVRRREFFSRLSIVLSAWAAAIIAIPFVGFLVAPLFERTAQVWRPVGPVDRFAVGTTSEVTFADSSPLPWAGVVARTAAWLRRDGEDRFIAFSVNCTHLGCPVRWLPDANLFMCPCHGGVYYNDGTVAAGPPPKPLPQYPVRVRGGQVEILTSPLPITTTVK